MHEIRHVSLEEAIDAFGSGKYYRCTFFMTDVNKNITTVNFCLQMGTKIWIVLQIEWLLYWAFAAIANH